MFLQRRPPRIHPRDSKVFAATLIVILYIRFRCGSQALPSMVEGPDGETFITSLSPTFSPLVPGLIQVLIAQYPPGQGSITTRAFPSPRAQCPTRDGSAAAGVAPRIPAIPNTLSPVIFASALAGRNRAQGTTFVQPQFTSPRQKPRGAA